MISWALFLMSGSASLNYPQPFAACLASKRPQQVRQWIEADGPMLIWKELEQVSKQSDCTPSEGYVGEYWTFRGALAEAMLLAEKTEVAEVDFDAVPKRFDFETAKAMKNKLGRKSMTLNVVADCVARQNFQGVTSLLKTSAYSTEQKAAFDSINGSLSACQAAAGGYKIADTKIMVRARLAIAAYFLNYDAQHQNKAAD